MYKAYLISLTNPDEKIKYLKENGVYPTFIKGVNGKALNIEDEEMKNVSNFYKKIGPKSAIGCALSHLNTWKIFLDNTTDQYAIIFEDDIILVEDFTNKLDVIMSHVPKDFDILYIGCTVGCKCKNNFILRELLFYNAKRDYKQIHSSLLY